MTTARRARIRTARLDDLAVVYVVFSRCSSPDGRSRSPETRTCPTDDDEGTKAQKVTSAALFAAATGIGAYVGYRRVTRCRAAREAFPQRNPYPYAQPYGAQPYGMQPYAAPQPYPGQPPQPYPGTQPAPTVTPPTPSSGLGTEGDVCAESAECATGLACTNNVCVRPN